jgi:hypothetical protein
VPVFPETGHLDSVILFVVCRYVVVGMDGLYTAWIG